MSSSCLVQSGSFKVEEDSEGSFITCVTAGEISFPQHEAYGSWEWEMYKAPLSTSFVYFTGDKSTLVNYTGMAMWSNSNEMVGARKLVGGGSTDISWSATSTIVANTWCKYKVTRTLDNEYTLYVDDELIVMVGGAVGTNPFTDAVPSTSQFAVIDMDAGDRIRNFRHSLGVLQ